MQNVVPATAAIFLKLQAVRVVPLVLRGSVIALLAGSAGQVNYNSVLLSCHFKQSLSLKTCLVYSSAGQTFCREAGAKNSQKNSGVFSPRMYELYYFFFFRSSYPQNRLMSLNISVIIHTYFVRIFFFSGNLFKFGVTFYFYIKEVYPIFITTERKNLQ